ncbi:helicase-exonuclease AddAB subunit AddA [Sporosarcina trichiuri]|uniref:helicase-exonuclease AddAB subunit AddA n=1 Tax=Sporosarcina trichiuri TaxID=3056445 RepID=UPI0025B433AE|nr:helicase-exonuclease AddAB subunit AddA [Sporosarcina sp. 0.2-SM1T-5]WJY26066.1 helicase-exonuclease AddAB subunit AddA [Sporosarcina sp. 0.2-SM1T-5]
MHIPPKPADVTFTDAQWQAIYASGRDILVSAAAGSGKTKVLITRLIEKVLDETNPVNVDDLLVVTFTNAAAAEMRHRMGAALEEEIARNPESAHLRKQLSLLNKAQISSLHSFCLTIVRQYAYLLDIDPGFRIADPTEAALLRDDTIEDVLEEAYSADNPEAIYRLADSFTSDRNDQSLELLIDRLYDYSRVHPEPEQWLRQIPLEYELTEDADIDSLSFIGPLKSAIRQKLEEAEALTLDMQRIAEQPDGPAPLVPTAEADLAWIRGALGTIEEGTWEETYAYFGQLKWVKAGSVKKDSCDEELAKRAKALRESVKKLVGGVRESFFERTPARLLDEIRLMAPMMHTLIGLVIDFGERYRAVKTERGLVDFSDLEHYALGILSKQEGDVLVPSDIAADYQAKFKEVLVDEYQDTNLLQEAIIQFVKSGAEADGNLFMVGDVKQSIYRFRLAEPGLFLSKYGRFTEQAAGEGLKIDLNANFRSRKEVLDATNFIFTQIMGRRVGEIEYDEAAELKYGARYPESDTAAHLTVLYSEEEEYGDETGEDLENLKNSQAEARYMAKTINRWMTEKHEVSDAFSGEKRPIRYSDIVVLMRSMTWSSEIADEFKRAGIPVYVELSSGYFDALEVTIMLNTLRTIDNPYQDIPLASVLRAPFVGMTENELAQVRLADKNASYYDALKTFIVTQGTGMAPETQQKLQRFLLMFEQWRNLARRGSLSELIWQVYSDTNYYEMVGSMPNGKQRQANLRALHDRAIDYEKTSFRGLFRFLRFVDRMRRRGDDLGAARFLSEKEDVVRIMTIHSSKGLEFPNVFVAGLGRQFNKMDFNEPYLFDQHFGLAVKAIDPDKRIMYTSLPFLAMKEQKELEMRAEEMRVLYVAMTRAKEQLELVATVKDIEKSVTKWQDAQLIQPEERLPDYMRSRANGYLDWIGPAVARHQDFVKFGTAPGAMVKDHPSRWDITMLPVSYFSEPAAERAGDEEAGRTPAELPPADEALVAEVTARFDFRYSHEASVRKRSKISVSELKRVALLEAEPDYNDPFATRDTETNPMFLHERPAFLQKRSISAAEVGTAMHTVMQHIDLDRTYTADDVGELLSDLLDRQLLTSEEAGAINRERIVQVMRSPLAERMRHAKRVLKELPFTYAYDGADGDSQILQGIADCLFEEEDGWVLLDYKTDRLRGRYSSETEADEAMRERYAIQLSLYKKAVEAITHIEIKEMLLYLFDEGRTVPVQEVTV